MQFLTEELANDYSRHNRAEVTEVVKNKTAKSRENFGEPNEWGCLGNCQYNIETGERKPHSPDGEYLYKIDVDYNEDATCPKFDRFLVQHVPLGRLKYVWGMFAHSLHRGYPTQSAFLLWGDTATGKSTTLRVLEHLIGQENVAAQSVRQLKNGNHAMANLYGKQANIIAEAPSPQEMKQQEFKALTGGDLIHANPKHQQPFEFYNSATMIFATNDMLDLEDLDDLEAEFLRRWEQIKYQNTVPESEREDNYYRRFTEDEEEMEGILNRALEAAYRMGQRGSLSFEWDELWNYYEDLEERVKDAEDDEDIEGGIESGWFDN
jgi:putative DNA primase/helicase